MEPARRRRLQSADRRNQLLALGLEMLSVRPADRLSTDDIAAAAGISKGLLFHYFPTKRDFHVAVVRAAADQLLAVTEPDPSLPVVERLREALDSFVGFVEGNRDLYVALVRGAAGADPELQEIFDANRTAVAGRVLRAIGETDPAPLLVLAAMGWVGFVEESTLHWLRHGEVGRDALIALQERTLLDTLAATAATARPAGRPTQI